MTNFLSALLGGKSYFVLLVVLRQFVYVDGVYPLYTFRCFFRCVRRAVDVLNFLVASLDSVRPQSISNANPMQKRKTARGKKLQ